MCRQVHYSSKMNHDTPSPDTAYTGLSNPRTPLKKANLYIWLTLQQQLSQVSVSNNTTAVTGQCQQQQLSQVSVSNNTAVTGQCQQQQLSQVCHRSVSATTAVTGQCQQQQLSHFSISNNSCLRSVSAIIPGSMSATNISS